MGTAEASPSALVRQESFLPKEEQQEDQSPSVEEPPKEWEVEERQEQQEEQQNHLEFVASQEQEHLSRGAASSKTVGRGFVTLTLAVAFSCLSSLSI